MRGSVYAKERKAMTWICILLAILLLIPIPMLLKDGVTIAYHAILHRIEDVHRLNPDINPEQKYLEGIVVEVLGVEVFHNVK